MLIRNPLAKRMEICPLTKNFKCCTLISDLLLARESKLNGLLLVAMDLCKPHVLMSDRSAIVSLLVVRCSNV